jgi:hypothetical protein
VKWEPSTRPSARVAFGAMKNKRDAHFLHRNSKHDETGSDKFKVKDVQQLT